MMMLVQACASIVIGCINLCRAVGAVLTNAADSSMIQEEGGVHVQLATVSTILLNHVKEVSCLLLYIYVSYISVLNTSFLLGRKRRRPLGCGGCYGNGKTQGWRN